MYGWLGVWSFNFISNYKLQHLYIPHFYNLPYYYWSSDSMSSFRDMAKIIGCSIEMEPKTLSVDQLNSARELAEDVMQNMQPEDISTIFTEAVLVSAEDMNHDKGVEGTTVETRKKGEDEEIDHLVCQCDCIHDDPTNSVYDEVKLKEPFTAPF